MKKVSWKRIRRMAGFTLIELLTAALIAGIFLAGTAGIVTQVMRIDRQESGRTEVQAELTQALDFIQKDISEAVFIYSDLTTVDAGTGAITAGADGIPDLNQLLYDQALIPDPAESIPIVAFWKFESIPNECLVNGALKAQPPTPDPTNPADTRISAQDWGNVQQRRNIYTLVVYYLRRNYNNAGNPVDPTTPWEGNARITRYTLEPFDDNCNLRNPSFATDPDPFVAGFLSWPDPLPAVGTRAGDSADPNDTNVTRDPITLVSNIYSSRQGRELAAPACDADYSFGGVKPASVTFTGLSDSNADASFYMCVRQSPEGVPQDVQITLTGISLERANEGLFRRYAGAVTEASELELSGYLHTFESRVLSRGVINRSA